MMVCIFVTGTEYISKYLRSKDGETTSGLSLSLEIRNLKLFLEC